VWGLFAHLTIALPPITGARSVLLSGHALWIGNMTGGAAFKNMAQRQEEIFVNRNHAAAQKVSINLQSPIAVGNRRRALTRSPWS
jgi:hypothetical protein